MTNKKHASLFAFLLPLVLAADGRCDDGAFAHPNTIAELMTPQQRAKTGLDKLTPQELDALSDWLRTNVTQLNPATEAAVTRTEGEKEEALFGLAKPPKTSAPEPELKAQVLQPFRGWSGKTVFKLDNGQVWVQRRAGQFTYGGDDTRVVISKNSVGFFEMTLVNANRTVGVSRVK